MYIEARTSETFWFTGKIIIAMSEFNIDNQCY